MKTVMVREQWDRKQTHLSRWVTYPYARPGWQNDGTGARVYEVLNAPNETSALWALENAYILAPTIFSFDYRDLYDSAQTGRVIGRRRNPADVPPGPALTLGLRGGRWTWGGSTTGDSSDYLAESIRLAWLSVLKKRPDLEPKFFAAYLYTEPRRVNVLVVEAPPHNRRTATLGLFNGWRVVVIAMANDESRNQVAYERSFNRGGRR